MNSRVGDSRRTHAHSQRRESCCRLPSSCPSAYLTIPPATGPFCSSHKHYRLEDSRMLSAVALYRSPPLHPPCRLPADSPSMLSALYPLLSLVFSPVSSIIDSDNHCSSLPHLSISLSSHARICTPPCPTVSLVLCPFHKYHVLPLEIYVI
jgi:hypothetical protein